MKEIQDDSKAIHTRSPHIHRIVLMQEEHERELTELLKSFQQVVVDTDRILDSLTRQDTVGRLGARCQG